MVPPAHSSPSPPASSPSTARRSMSPSPVHRSVPPHRTASVSSRSRARSLSPATSPMQPLDALGASSPPHSNPPRPVAGAFASRPSPVVPPSPSVPSTPAFSYVHSNSRPTSPRPSRLGSEEPGSPTREGRGGAAAMLGEAAGGAAMGRSGSQVDLSHIFERDVEFAPSHHISPSEAVDVAVPPVLTEAAVALSASSDDPLVSHDLEALIHESEADAQAGSGWSSPVVAPTHAQHHAHHPSISHSQSSQPHHHLLGQQQLPPIGSPHAHTYANASRSPVRSSHSRSFSPDSLTGASASGLEALSSGEDRRAASPGGSSTTFSVDSPPTSTGEISPPGTSAGGAGAFGLGPFGKKLAEALENEANKLPAGLVGTSPSANATAMAKTRETSPPPATTAKGDGPSSPARAAASASPTSSPLRPSSLLSPLTLPVPFPASSTASPSGGASENPFVSTTTSPLPSPPLELSATSSPSASSGASPHTLCAPHPRRLSFLSYADVINEERMAELTGEGGSATGGAATPAGGQGKKGGVGAGEVEGRLAGLLLGE
ncbi:hypothetical protein JCM1840_000915 [Sporobolomyces johnsonii]